MHLLSAGVSLRVRRSIWGWGRRGVIRGGRGWLRSGGGGGSGSKSWFGVVVRGGRRRLVDGRGRRFTVVVIVFVFVIDLEIVTRVRNGSGPWSRGRGRLSNGGGRISSWAAVGLAALEGLAVFQGVATVVEELSVFLVLTTDCKVTGVVVLV